MGGKQGAIYRKSSDGPNGWVNTNLRTTFEKIVRRAGLEQWPRLFQNLRSSCETDLMKRHPMPTVAAWMGHSIEVAVSTTRKLRLTNSPVP